jgi:WhiB family transcriptional regulator, redox-sensing transcriptional regulator
VIVDLAASAVDWVSAAYDSQPWKRDAACLEHPELDWFSDHGGRAAKAVLAVCAACLVVDECGEYAIAEGIADGVWGGLTPTARRKLLAERKAGRKAG